MAPTYSAFPFPKSLFERFVRENDGKLILRVCLHTHLAECIKSEALTEPTYLAGSLIHSIFSRIKVRFLNVL